MNDRADATAVDIDAVTATTARALLRLRGETASRALAELPVHRDESLTDDQKTTFFTVLLEEFGAVREDVDAAIERYRQDPSEATLVALSEASDSQRLALFRALNPAPGGIEMLLDMRADLLGRRGSHPEFAPVERDLQHLLRSWFNRGFLRLEQLDWTTPAHILESLIRYEAVHEIRGVDDLRRRLAPDRRSFGFFQRGLPADPVARFHLRNGARVERINPGGDTSAKGMAESHGLLVNYLYSGQDLVANNEALTLDGVVTASPEVVALLPAARIEGWVRTASA